VKAMADQEPSPSSRIRLGSARDHRGVPIAELDWRLSERDRWSMSRAQELLAPALSRRLGADVHSLLVDEDLPDLGVGCHHMGTTRMSTSPRHGVVDADCRVHGTDNLYVAGSSVFPTGGTANPTLTIVALADRLASHLAATVPGRQPGRYATGLR
jgi:choline dehydrogenase-like flavoprotein